MTRQFGPGPECNHLSPDEKLTTLGGAEARIRALRHNGLVVVLAQGVFDLMHLGHTGYLKAAAAAGDVLVVGVENDDTVRANKGVTRPINTLEERLALLAELVVVDAVFGFEDTPSYTDTEPFIRRYAALHPDAVAVPTWDPNWDLKEFQASEADVGITPVDFLYTNSTTKLLERIGFKE